MRKRVKVKQLQRNNEHRKAMLSNLVTSLLYHEEIKTTVAKAKATRSLAEKLITRAKKNAAKEMKEEQKLHNIRQAAKTVKDKEVLHKLFNDIGQRFVERPGGYTRVLKIGKRGSDNSEMALLQLVEKKELAQLKDDRKEFRESLKKKQSDK